jgi:hypothetical protein
MWLQSLDVKYKIQKEIGGNANVAFRPIVHLTRHDKQRNTNIYDKLQKPT